MAINVRAGFSSPITVTGLTDLPASQSDVSIDISGTDAVDISITFYDAALGTLVFQATFSKNATPGLRDISLVNNTLGGDPLIKRDFINVLRYGCEGSQWWFFTGTQEWPSGNVTVARPSDLLVPFTDTYDALLPPEKDSMYAQGEDINTASSRIYMWDSQHVGTSPRLQPSIDPGITGVTAKYAYDLGVNTPDLIIDESEGIPKGYTQQDPVTGDWTEPDAFLINNQDPGMVYNIPRQWQGSMKAVAVAPDEMTSGLYGVAPLGANDAGRKPAGSDLDSDYRAWAGFPRVDPAVASTQRKYRMETLPVPEAGYATVEIPKNFYNRKPYYYFSTGHCFWSRERISTPKQNAPLANVSTKYPSIDGNPLNFYNVYWAMSQQFIGLPLTYRTSNDETFNDDYEAPFSQLKTFMEFNNLGYNWSPDGRAYGVIYITIDPVEILLPGPVFDGGMNGITENQYRQKNIYKRNRNSFTNKSKVKVWWQDLWAHNDSFQDPVLPFDPQVEHTLSDPVLLAEGYCPRFDVSIDYFRWRSTYNAPGQEPVQPTIGSLPAWDFESTPFELHQVAKDPSDVILGPGIIDGNPGQWIANDEAGKAKIIKMAEMFCAEFNGYKAKIKVQAAWWPTNDQDKIGYFTTGRSAAAPYDGDYWQGFTEREGCWIAPSGYIEVIK
jgi:hypothetical protein